MTMQPKMSVAPVTLTPHVAAFMQAAHKRTNSRSHPRLRGVRASRRSMGWSTQMMAPMTRPGYNKDEERLFAEDIMLALRRAKVNGTLIEII
jgi:hypothetical protein